jgi:hypothetical protein
MDEAMVVAAEEEAVVQACLSAIGPMLHMVGIGEAEPAPWEPAPPVTDLEGAA